MPSIFKRTVLALACSLSLMIPPAQAEDDQDLKTSLELSLMFEFFQAIAQTFNTLPSDCAKAPKNCTPDKIEPILSKSLSSSAMLQSNLSDLPTPEMAGMMQYLATKAKPEQLKKFQAASQTYAQAVKEFQHEVLGDQSVAMQKAQDKAVLGSVKSNMHTLQTIVETYAVDWGGVYASDVTMLKTEADKPNMQYWKDFLNPFTGKMGNGKSGSYMDYKTYKNYKPHKDFAGLALYAPEKSPVVTYYIYGCDKDGQLIQDKGKVFYLTNS